MGQKANVFIPGSIPYAMAGTTLPLGDARLAVGLEMGWRAIMKSLLISASHGRVQS